MKVSKGLIVIQRPNEGHEALQNSDDVFNRIQEADMFGGIAAARGATGVLHHCRFGPAHPFGRRQIGEGDEIVAFEGMDPPMFEALRRSSSTSR